jgi:hypothetical protein
MRTKKSNFLLISAIAFALVTMVLPAQAAVWDSTRVYTGTVQMYDLAVGSKLKGASDDTVRIFTTQYDSPYKVLLFTDRSTALPMNWVTDIIYTDASGNIGAAIGDPDRDGQNELLFGRWSSGYQLRMAKWNGSAWITSTIATLPYPIYDIAVGDANNDGSNDDIIAATAAAVFRVSWNGASWDTTRILNSGLGTYGVAIGNFDAAYAGNEIVAVTMMSKAFRIRWTGAAWDTLTIYYNSSPSVYDVTVGDFDASNPGDEIALSSSHYSTSTHGAVIELYGSGASWSSRDLYSPLDWGTFAEIAAGDFYAGNAGAEIAAISGSGDSNQVRLIYGSGTSWHNEKIMGTGGMYNYGVAIGNVNRYRPGDELAVGGNRKVWEAEERIEGGAYYAITPESLVVNALEGQLTDAYLTVSNPGGQAPLSYKMTDPVDWLSENPDTAEIPPDDSLIVTVSVDGHQLIAGDYYTEIAVKTNAVNQQYDTVPVFVHVGPDPEIEVSPDSIVATCQEGSIRQDTIIISNSGDGHLIFSIAEECPWITVLPDVDTVNPLESMMVIITEDCYQLSPGDHLCELSISSNDPDEPLVVFRIYKHVFPSGSVFIAHFMTPEGEPYPFDVTISDGEWVQVFDSVTYIETAVPETATYTYSYRWGDYVLKGRFDLTLSPSEIKEFRVYATDLTQMQARVRPYLSLEEVGANASLSWQWDPVNDILTWNLSAESLKCVGVRVLIEDSTQAPPNFVLDSVQLGDGVKIAEHSKQETIERPPYAQLTNLLWDHGYVTGEYHFSPIDSALATVRIEYAVYNDAIVVHPIATTLNHINGTEYPPQFFDPQYGIPQGNYLLLPTNLPTGYLSLRLPLNVPAGKGVDMDLYPPKIADLEPFTFSVCAEYPLARSAYSNLFHDPDDSITVDVSTQSDLDWWGYFALPKSLTVDKLFAYSDTLGEEELEDTIDYIINPIEGSNLFLVVVRNQFYYDRLKLEYARRGDVNRDGKINAADVVYLINYLFIHGPEPIPREAGDVNCDAKISASDVVYLINYLFIGGPPPCS